MKHYSIIAVLLLSAFILRAQNDTTLYFGVNGKTGLITSNLIKKEVEYKSNNKVKVKTYRYNESGWEKNLTEIYNRTDELTYRITPKSGGFKRVIKRRYIPHNKGLYEFTDVIGETVVRKGFTKSLFPLILHGEVTEFYQDGKIKSVSEYNNNELMSNKNWLKDGSKYIDNVFYSVDSLPRFKGGLEYLHKHILENFKRHNVDFSSITGEIQIGFVVMETGEIKGLRLLKGISVTLNDIAMNSFITLEGSWEPARLNGEKVRYFQVFPINFKSNNARFDFIDFTGGVMHWESN